MIPLHQVLGRSIWVQGMCVGGWGRAAQGGKRGRGAGEGIEEGRQQTKPDGSDH